MCTLPATSALSIRIYALAHNERNKVRNFDLLLFVISFIERKIYGMCLVFFSSLLSSHLISFCSPSVFFSLESRFNQIQLVVTRFYYDHEYDVFNRVLVAVTAVAVAVALLLMMLMLIN